MDEPHADPRDELFEIATSVRALVEWYDSTGAWGLPLAPARDVEPAYPAAEPHAAPPPPNPRAAAPVADRRPVPSDSTFAQPAQFTPPPERAQVPQYVPPSPPAERPQRPAAARPEARTPEARIEQLRVLASEVASCTRCRLAERRTQTVFARGNPLSELCFVGEGPGVEEDLAGEPFVGPAGQLLDKMIAAMGYRPGEVYICNIVKCRPPENRKPQPDEMEACKGYLASQLELARPRYIVALGATAIQGLLGTTEGITKLRGKWKMYRGTPVMPTFHPAYLLRQPSAKREVWTDLQEVMARLGKKPPARG
ncbi:uracil-DNA glycosylase [Polyangium sorediatum]|uniref:Type-4 uracil-DNA glycosylase n=1 Tax=Polyangium sorediatum TaxID=889274 RepID=A0ABT6NHX7_9BACT|nr:uracil-DNA glycosylase family protein [Polyangium sorediatum]MDI1427923.1 uracil-DNA glycosylase family protein [Polyangium sorediatum]